MSDKAYGSGAFGEWIEDDFGLPAYRYTCDQINDPKAVSPTNPIWRSPTDHSHQIGNDRLVAVASNYGYIQVRQDEGSPKFLNDFDPDRNMYAGGFGYLTDGENVLSTFYPGGSESFERIFGIGYLRKIVKSTDYEVDQVIFAPFGDDPLLISQVTIKNNGQEPARLRWIEYWDSQMHQFSFRATILAMVSRGKAFTPDLRRSFSESFSHRFTVIGDGDGLLNEKLFHGYSLGERFRWWMAKLVMATIGKRASGGGVYLPVNESYLEDLNPPPTFLISLDEPVDGYSTNGTAFFAEGGVGAPSGLAHVLSRPDPMLAEGSALLLEREVQLAPTESSTMYFAYGYLPQGFEIEEILSKYRQNLPDRWSQSSQAWKGNRIQLTIPNEKWVDRELTWHNYYLRGNLTFDSFFKEHILSQGHVYTYAMGFQGAARDPIQHALPFTFCRPEIVKEVLRYTLKEVQPDGEIPYGIVGHGVIMPSPFRPSDLEMWLLWLVSEYVLATKDSAFLEEIVATYPVYGGKSKAVKVLDLLALCYDHLVRVTGTGKHDLLRMSNGDWNDLAVIGFVPDDREEDVRQHGESVLNAAFASYTLELLARMLTYVGENAFAEDARQRAAAQREAVREQWTGKWFRRQWLTEDLGWIGEDVLWLEPQPWAIIGGAATEDHQKVLIQYIDELVRKPSPIGAMLLGDCLEQIPSPPGNGTNAGIWPSINGTLIWALAKVDGELAWDEWKKNTLAQHAEAYPEVWYGIWSGPDTYNSTYSEYPGQTIFDYGLMEGLSIEGRYEIGLNWTDFPVMNMHPHAWPLYTVTKLMGIEFTPEGVELTPSLPISQYRFASPLLGLEKSNEGYSGWYAPKVSGTWQITLHLSPVELETLNQLNVNGERAGIRRLDECTLAWSGTNAADKPLHWELNSS
ncbi:MAG: hypothetical protein GTO18_20045 [Anaerolineales bacterium]|nr:hypothetical protein [Anaerolineales bacterium]